MPRARRGRSEPLRGASWEGSDPERPRFDGYSPAIATATSRSRRLPGERIDALAAKTLPDLVGADGTEPVRHTRICDGTDWHLSYP